jgi:ABC-2 type transport system ATP-binding protein
VALVSALAAPPESVELLLLDEPTSGLDPLMEAVFQDCIREETGRGRTVLLSSHILAEAEALCDRVSIIRAGRTVQHGTLDELRHLTRTTVVVETERSPDALGSVPGVAHVERLDPKVRFDVDTDHLDEAMEYLAGLRIRSLVSHPPTLEELFLRQFGETEGVVEQEPVR